MPERFSLESRIADVVGGRPDGQELLLRHGYWLGEGFVDTLSQFQTMEDASREGRLRDVDGLLAALNGTSKQ